MIAHARARFSLSLMLLGLAASGQAELRERVMVLDDDLTSVRELHQVTVKPGTETLAFPNLPQDLDPGSLGLRDLRGRLGVNGWTPLKPVSAGEVQSAIWPRSVTGSSIPEEKGWAAECEIRTRGEISLELQYLCPKLPWAVSYDLSVRMTPEMQERVSCDLRGQVRIDNPTAFTFSNAVLRLLQPLGAIQEKSGLVEKAPGFLMDDSGNPLKNWWTRTPEDHGIRRSYRLPEPVTLQSKESVHVTLLDKKRIKAGRLYRHRSTVPDEKGLDGSFHQIIRILNTSENGLGQVLPGGPVNVFSAGSRRPLAEGGMLAQTEVGDHVEIDLGPSEELLSEMLPEQRRSRRQGQLEVRTQIRIQNRLPFDVPIQWEYDPASSLQWRLLSSNVESEIQDGILLLSSTVPGDNIRVLDFTLEFVVPTL